MFSIIPNGTYANNNLGQMQMPAQNQLIPGTAPMEVEGAVVGRGNGPHGECITCDSRRYVDDSTDSGVSFQVPTHISPEQSFSKVRAHEYEHLRRDRASAEADGRRVIYQSVTFHMATCPECGQRFKAGGEARTVSRTTPEHNHNAPYEETRSFDTYM